MKKISIIIAAYNAGAYIERCIDSALSQNRAELEIIAVNDGSIDNTYEILNKYRDRIIIINKKNGGVAAARNDALAVCTGDYVLFLDSDDYLPDNTIESYMALCDGFNPDIIRGNYILIFDNSSSALPKKRIKTTRLIYKDRFKTEVYPYFITGILLNTCCASLIKREIIKTEFRSDMKTGEDAVFMMNVYSNANSVFFIDMIMYNYYQTGTGLTGKGLKAAEKFKCNILISREIIGKLKNWGMKNLTWIIRAYIRPLVITLDKLNRLFGDSYDED